MDTSKKSAAKKTATKTPVAAGVEATIKAKVEAAKVEAAKVEAAKVEAAKVEAAKVEAAKVEAAKVEAAKVEAAKGAAILDAWLRAGGLREALRALGGEDAPATDRRFQRSAMHAEIPKYQREQREQRTVDAGYAGSSRAAVLAATYDDSPEPGLFARAYCWLRN